MLRYRKSKLEVKADATTSMFLQSLKIRPKRKNTPLSNIFKILFPSLSFKGPANDSGNMSEVLTILHFNDVYNIEGQKDEPMGGAARMQTYIKSQQGLDPLLLFSGDALNPSLSESALSQHKV